MENKYEEMRQQIKDKKDQIDALKMDVKELEANIEQYLPGRFADILEKANTLLNKYYIYYNSYCNALYLHYCKNIKEYYDGIGIEYTYIEIAKSDKIIYNESYYVLKDISIEDFDRFKILNEKQMQEIYDRINKTIRREQSIDDLYSFLKDMYNSMDEMVYDAWNSLEYKINNNTKD